ncbi:di-heme oxidoredictase family protein [Pseudomonas sp. RIT-PI-S]|uniref:di-heme oxidoreductase family protein n=1 Tax=Pseudomonas sp. RIT-PI-S TaxID=3035295 RepID=UPI0021DA22BC|nr:di-heme oxidoredictase family protein [Pseudomonas sp. RIT-PI-S]
MLSTLGRFPLLLLALSLAACDQAPDFSQAEPDEARSAGAATVWRRDVNAYALPSANLSAARRVDFSAGNSFFRSPWVIAPSTTTARDGLGPLFNTNACQNCHIRDGRGQPPETDAPNAVSMLVRLAVPPTEQTVEVVRRLGAAPEPVYGTQLQDMAIPGVPPEGRVRVAYEPMPVTFADGFTVELRKPRLRIDQLGYGPLHPQVRTSARIAPPMIGLGLLEAIPERAILENARLQATGSDGVRGRPNRVFDDASGQTVLGRFGWKATQPNLDQQNAHAFASDLGITSSLLPADDCTSAQAACRNAANGNQSAQQPFEVSDNIRRLVLFYSRNLGVPARRGESDARVLQGKALFHQAGCQSCHVAQYRTRADAAEPELANQLIRPYTDLLLHDMGPGLADDYSVFDARGQDWRTPPLWGIGLSATVNPRGRFLHDGRARDLLEAVLWHDGEAASAKQRVLRFDVEERAALLAFLQSL